MSPWHQTEEGAAPAGLAAGGGMRTHGRFPTLSPGMLSLPLSFISHQALLLYDLRGPSHLKKPQKGKLDLDGIF